MAYKKSDLVGKRFGRLVVIDLIRLNGERRQRALCRCDCGNEKAIVIHSMIKHGGTSSCGCLWTDAIKESTSTHGMTGTKIHNAWRSMKARCYIKSCSNYSYYGGRGITVCEEWIHSFEAFRDWAVLHGYSEELTLDRIESTLGYFPTNCRWEDKNVQARNRRTRKTSGTGVTGVHKRNDRPYNSYRASICTSGKVTNLGSFQFLFEAAEARRQAEIEQWGFSLTE